MECRRRRPRRRPGRATRRRSARRSSAPGSPASRRSRSSAARACASGCIPTKAWVQTAHALHAAREVNAKLGVTTGEPKLDFAPGERVEGAVVKQMTGGVAHALQGERRRRSLKGVGRFEDAQHDRVRAGRRGPHLQERDRRHAARTRSARRSRASTRRAASTRPACSRRREVPRRLVVLGGGIIGCEFASIFERFGTEVTIVEMLDSLIPQEDADATKELRKAFAQRGIVVHLGKQCTQVEDTGSGLVVHFGEGETVECDLMLVSVGRAPLVEGIGLEQAGVAFDKRAGIQTDDHRRTSVPHIYAAGDVAGYWQLAHTVVPRGRDRGRERDAATTPRSATRRCRARSTPTPRSPASGSPRRRRASATATTTSPSAASRGSRTRAR